MLFPEKKEIESGLQYLAVNTLHKCTVLVNPFFISFISTTRISFPGEGS